MIEVKITNKIEEKLNQLKKEKGISKTWIAEQIGISRQSLNILCKTNNPTIESLIKVAYIIDCDVKDLYEIKKIKVTE